MNACAQYLSLPANHTPCVEPVVRLDWSILSTLPTAVKLTIEGEGVTSELATGSITSSRVMEFTSNQASEMFQATLRYMAYHIHTADAHVVNSSRNKVQSLVHDRVFVVFIKVEVHVDAIVYISKNEDIAATLLVLT